MSASPETKCVQCQRCFSCQVDVQPTQGGCAKCLQCQDCFTCQHGVSFDMSKQEGCKGAEPVLDFDKLIYVLGNLSEKIQSLEKAIRQSVKGQ